MKKDQKKNKNKWSSLFNNKRDMHTPKKDKPVPTPPKLPPSDIDRYLPPPPKDKSPTCDRNFPRPPRRKS